MDVIMCQGTTLRFLVELVRLVGIYIWTRYVIDGLPLNGKTKCISKIPLVSSRLVVVNRLFTSRNGTWSFRKRIPRLRGKKNIEEYSI